ncbi:type II secretion system protein N [Shewanella sp. SM72]|uniref:type II secretion system protein N n=1 Tax=Shewanella TaxID=22 RepID=UPI000DEB4931|nr:MULTISPECIES: type II secretion system protein N [Shewanella]RBP74826.1 type II secretion system protein N (GspN) [Shewanella putrefaciens]MCU8017572.1 type II secretion system protein N [Shewanella sp. SM72]MCU8031305.1 type II secretion system protein N [Shewanella sp. SM73]MCU8092757.1 type II secretion system protein N [Shewanella sp. SM20]WVI93584.1 type II secretion system protein N [Shewanella oncorhynchi]
MSLIKKVIIGVLIYLIFLVVLFPAKIAIALAPLPANISVSGVSGSIWSGSIETLSMPQRQVEQVRWDLSPWALFLGKVKVDFQVGSRATPVSAKGLISWSMGGLSAQGLRFEAPDSFLLGNAKLPFKTEITGEVSLLVETLEQGKPWCEQLSGKLFLNQTNVKNQFGNYPLGNIELGLSCVEGKAQLATDETKNQLGIVGTLQLDEGNMVKVEAKIKETAEQPEDMRESLNILGKRGADGYFPVVYQGRIPGL